MIISEKISILRKQRGMSQEQLAFALDVSRQAVYKWETGASTPDINKVKKIASYFNISFDTLLDDSLDISTEITTHPQEQKTDAVKTTLERKFRPVFISGIRPRPDQSDEDAGYFNIKGVRHQTMKSTESLQKNRKITEELVKKQGYRVLLPLHKHAHIYFFIDDARKCCGLIFNAAEQFVCPFENFIGIREFATEHPGIHRITISFYNLNGTPNTYSFDLYPYRLLSARVKSSNYRAWSRDVSLAISTNMQAVEAYAKFIIEAGEQLRRPEAVAPKMDIEGYRSRSEESRKRRGQLIKNYIMPIRRKRKIATNIFLSVIGAIALLILSIIIINGAKNSITNARINKVNNMIESVLADENASFDEYDAIFKKYDALTKNEKQKIDDWNRFVSDANTAYTTWLKNNDAPITKLEIEDVAGEYRNENGDIVKITLTQDGSELYLYYSQINGEITEGGLPDNVKYSTGIKNKYFSYGTESADFWLLGKKASSERYTYFGTMWFNDDGKLVLSFETQSLTGEFIKVN